MNKPYIRLLCSVVIGLFELIQYLYLLLHPSVLLHQVSDLRTLRYGISRGDVNEAYKILKRKYDQKLPKKKKEKKKKRKKEKKCVGRESNPDRLLGRQPC